MVPIILLGTPSHADRLTVSIKERTDPMRKNPFLIGGLSLMALLAAACNTIEGAGEDVEATGEEIEETANEAGA